ncbi:hypothetical protein PanWU01x14_038800 [Parasponia andersonii]|uniref:Uncharacterized protein n=1 Tax=Parasponia andersonii TaxID=3476 RepID=A0A2P5DRN1_PARAD|nr:hypothetical protein PanWU01x14_038800 [Parasponia andersonii]
MGYDQLQVVGDFSFNVKNDNILSRNSSVGYSSRIYYYRTAGTGGIPFQWEMQPGTPKDPPKEEALPPLSPPPAVTSLGLPKPCVIDQEPCKPRRRLIRFWKRSKRNDHQLRAYNRKSDQSDDVQNGVSDYKDEKFEFCSSDCEFMASPARNSSSSSSPSLSFSNGFSSQSSRFQSPAWHPRSRSTLSCSPWNISTILVSLAKRV